MDSITKENTQKPYEKLEKPKDSFRELIGDENLEKIGKEDLERIDKSIDKKIADNKAPTLAEVKNLALRAVAKIEMNDGKASFLEQTRENIEDFCKENDITISKRQYSDIMTRAEKTMSPLEVRMDMYKVAQVNNLTNSFMDKMKDAEIPVSRRFEDLLAKNIERGKVSMASVQNVLDKTIDRVQEQEFEIDLKTRSGNDLLEIYTDYYVGGQRMGYVMSVDDRENKTGMVTAMLEDKSPDGKELFTIMQSEERGVYKTDKGQKLTFGEATEYAGKALTNAINTYRVINTFQMEIDEYINERRVESEMKKVDAALFPNKSRETAERSRKLEENLPAPEVKTETKGKQEPEKEYGGMEL